jgi:hypothetical protein
MKKITAAFLMLVVLSLGIAQEKKELGTKGKTGSHVMSGYLVDKMCGSNMAKLDMDKASERAIKHTKECALEDGCKATGYGILMKGKYFKFDAKGDKLAEEYLNKTTKANNILVDVACTMDGMNLKVESIKDTKSAEKKTEEKKN